MRDILHIWSKQNRLLQLCRTGSPAAKFENLLACDLSRQKATSSSMFWPASDAWVTMSLPPDHLPCCTIAPTFKTLSP